MEREGLDPKRQQGHGNHDGYVVSLRDAQQLSKSMVGGKGKALGRLDASGFPVASGVCVVAQAYRRFVEETKLHATLHYELQRKPFSEMRWEEIWDASLRLRNAFLKTPMPHALREVLGEALERAFGRSPVVVRSSSIAEDSKATSFAGLHHSVVNVRGISSILEAVRVVWASLWSDRALLYRKELGLDVEGSAIAVVVQHLVSSDRAGVVFSRSPLDPEQCALEAVWGLNEGLVDGTVSPDRWIVHRATREIVSHTAPSQRTAVRAAAEGGVLTDSSSRTPQRPPLDPGDVQTVVDLSLRLEELHGHPQDSEWGYAGDELVLFQSRPITQNRNTGKEGGADTGAPDEDGGGDRKRRWYLSLRRSHEDLKRRWHLITSELLPEMDADAQAMSGVSLKGLDDAALAEELDHRVQRLRHWKKVYWDEFIPFAHGMRFFGEVYNDTVKPDDPFEFISLLRGEDLLLLRRNQRLTSLAAKLGQQRHVLGDIERTLQLREGPLKDEVDAYLDEFGTTAPGEAARLSEQARLVKLLLTMSRADSLSGGESKRPAHLEQRFLESFGPQNRAVAEELLELARASYRLRDDDNLHLQRVEVEIDRAAEESKKRLLDKLSASHPLAGTAAWGSASGDLELASALSQGLRGDPSVLLDYKPPLTDTSPRPSAPRHMAPKTDAPRIAARQLVGQPAGPGLATGTARVVLEEDDIFDIQPGEVLVCDALSPKMTFVAPLVSAVVERRGGMLIHGAIIAREYGLACVTGVPEATRWIQTGDRLTVDGHLGLVIRETRR